MQVIQMNLQTYNFFPAVLLEKENSLRMLEFHEHFNSILSLLCIPWIVLAREFRVKQEIPVVLVGMEAQSVPLLPWVQNPPGQKGKVLWQHPEWAPLAVGTGWILSVLRTVLSQKGTSFPFIWCFNNFLKKKLKRTLKKFFKEGRVN